MVGFNYVYFGDTNTLWMMDVARRTEVPIRDLGDGVNNTRLSGDLVQAYRRWDIFISGAGLYPCSGKRVRPFDDAYFCGW